ncbi:MAG TPA: hypothetical protein VFA15_06075 [Nitrososphaera sp.]|nr:hypothetical protein [Nitrososphaera sp.]
MAKVEQVENRVNFDSDVPVEESLAFAQGALQEAGENALKLTDSYHRALVFAVIGIGHAICTHAATTWRVADALRDSQEDRDNSQGQA